MTKELRDKWVAALRSGKYKQTTGALYGGTGNIDTDGEREYGYCCLGVLCDIAFPHTRDSWEYSATLTDTEKGRVGLEQKDHEHCIAMNDTYKNTFDQIADWIEENL